MAAAHGPLLGLPYFWDEAGYFVFAGLDFFRHGWLIPHSTQANGHPPLLSVYLAAAWLLAGFHPWVTRLAMLAWATALALGVERLARPRLGRQSWIAALLVMLAPLVFAQASLAQLDLPVAALVVWALALGAEENAWAEAGLLAAACLMKETAAIVPLALLLLPSRRNARLLLPLGAVASWFLYFHHVTGFWLGSPDYWAYNVAQAAFSPGRIGLALLRRLWQLAFYDGVGALTVLALVSCWRCKQRRMPTAWMAVIAAYVLAHAVVGGAVLARYLLPALALWIVWCTEQILALPRRSGSRAANSGVLVAACAAVLVASWFWNPPYPFPYEDNLAYAQFVRLHQAAALALEAAPPPGPVWTAWPASDEISRPELGYVSRPLAVHEIQNFTPASLDGIEAKPDALLLFSRVFRPQHDWSAAVPWWRNAAARFFGYAAAAAPEAWMGKFDLKPVWQLSADGQWIMLARRSTAARPLAPPRPVPRRR